MASTRPPLSTRKTASVHAMKRTSPHVESTTRKDKKRKRHTFDHDIDRIWKEKDRGQQHDNHRAPPKARTVVLHIERQWRIIVVYPTPVVQESMRASANLTFEPRSQNTRQKKRGERDSPDARHVLAHLVCICALQLEQLCISLDFEKDFVPCRADDLRASASIRESCICEGVNGCKQVCG